MRRRIIRPPEGRDGEPTDTGMSISFIGIYIFHPLIVVSAGMFWCSLDAFLPQDCVRMLAFFRLWRFTCRLCQPCNLNANKKCLARLSKSPVNMWSDITVTSATTSFGIQSSLTLSTSSREQLALIIMLTFGYFRVVSHIDASTYVGRTILFLISSWVFSTSTLGFSQTRLLNIS